MVSRLVVSMGSRIGIPFSLAIHAQLIDPAAHGRDGCAKSSIWHAPQPQEVPLSPVALRFEVTILPVADVDRAKAFYQQLEWRLDADFPIDEHYRVVQFTPPGSPGSIQFGLGLTDLEPGAMQGMM